MEFAVLQAFVEDSLRKLKVPRLFFKLGEFQPADTRERLHRRDLRKAQQSARSTDHSRRLRLAKDSTDGKVAPLATIQL
jgi:hypothetical protein